METLWTYCFVNKEGIDENGCTFKNRYDFYKNITIDEEFTQFCPLECDSLHYRTSYSIQYSSKIKPVEKIKLLPQNELTKFYIYSREYKYTFISEEPNMNIADLISNIGGILGVFIGISFLSFIEIIDFLIEAIFILIKPIKINQQDHTYINN